MKTGNDNIRDDIGAVELWLVVWMGEIMNANQRFGFLPMVIGFPTLSISAGDQSINGER